MAIDFSPPLLSTLPSRLPSGGIEVDDLIALCIFAVGVLITCSKGILWNKSDPYAFILEERRQERLEDFKQKQDDKIRDVASYLKKNNKSVGVYWGSQSGTAEALSRRLSKALQERLGAASIAADISQFDPRSFSSLPASTISIFIFSTYGQGDPPDNLIEFWKWMLKDDSSLCNLRYAALGLGDSNYKDYNRVVDVLSKKIDQREATKLLPVGRADASRGETEADFMSWKEELFCNLRDTPGFEERELTYEPTIKVTHDETLQDLHIGVPFPHDPRIQVVPVRRSYDLCPGSSRHRLHFELDLSSYRGIQYKTGDHLEIWPINPAKEVDRLLHVLRLESKQFIPVSVQALDSSVKSIIPSPTTLNALFTHYLAICAPVSWDLIQSLRIFIPQNGGCAYLNRLATDKSAYESFMAHGHTLGGLLEIVIGMQKSEVNLPLSWVLERLPTLHPRLYSISSSAVVQPRQAAITVAVANNNQDKVSARGFGVATNYMLALQRSLMLTDGKPGVHPFGLTFVLDGPERLLAGGKMCIAVKRSRFRLPQAHGCPVVMIAAGTGLAPFRAFIQERARLKSSGVHVGAMKLFFGCRREDEDFLYREELAELKHMLGDGLDVITAFSRQDQNSAGGKMYVQNRVAERSRELCEQFTEDNCYFYLCGSAAMAREVVDTLGNAFERYKQWDPTQQKTFMDRMKVQRRWQEDVWG